MITAGAVTLESGTTAACAVDGRAAQDGAPGGRSAAAGTVQDANLGSLPTRPTAGRTARDGAAGGRLIGGAAGGAATGGTLGGRLTGVAAGAAFPDYRFAPNIGGHPDIYELENRALARAGHVLDAMRALAPWAGRTIVDLGCGTGFWLAEYAAQAGQVIGIEPDAGVRARAERAAASLPRTTVLAGSAEYTGLPDASADVVHARFAYFFPPGTEAGLAEVLRVLRPGGRLVVVDNDYRWGEFAGLLAAASSRPVGEVAATVDAWWRARGATRHAVRSELRFARRAELAAVLGIEFPARVARDWLARHPAATGLTYGYTLFTVTA